MALPICRWLLHFKLCGQAFHLLTTIGSPLSTCMLRLTGLDDMGQWQKESAKYALGIFVIFYRYHLCY